MNIIFYLFIPNRKLKAWHGEKLMEIYVCNTGTYQILKGIKLINTKRLHDNEQSWDKSILIAQ